MKTLVLVNHPDLKSSVINKRWAEELKKYPEQYTVHELNTVYRDGNIDIEMEQKLVGSHGNLILQFPIFWFNCPPRKQIMKTASEVEYPKQISKV